MSSTINNRLMFTILKSFSADLTLEELSLLLLVDFSQLKRIIYYERWITKPSEWPHKSFSGAYHEESFEKQFVCLFDRCFKKYVNSDIGAVKKVIYQVLTRGGFTHQDAEQVLEKYFCSDFQAAKNRLKDRFSAKEHEDMSNVIAKVDQAKSYDQLADHLFHEFAYDLIYSAQTRWLTSEKWGGNETIADQTTPDLRDMLFCMTHQGISGRMGREQMFALAKAGNQYACYEIGELYYHGYIKKTGEKNYQKACEWYSKAPDHPAANWMLGYCILNNFYPHVPNNEIDYKAALDYFNKAISIQTPYGESPEALTSIGVLWLDGHYPADDFYATRRCLPADEKKALEYFEKADRLGYHYATNRIALHHYNAGRYDEAFRHYSRSAEMIDDGYVLNNLGRMYENGLGCERNAKKACECYLKALHEVLEDDVTAWAKFNAGRVYATRVKDQPINCFKYDLNQAFELFVDSMRDLKTEVHDQMLWVMIDILLKDDLSSLTVRERKKWKHVTMDRAESYLKSVDIQSLDSKSKARAEEIQNRLPRLRYIGE